MSGWLSGTVDDGQRNILNFVSHSPMLRTLALVLVTSPATPGSPAAHWSFDIPSSRNVSPLNALSCSMYGRMNAVHPLPTLNSAPSGQPCWASWKLWQARPSCLRLFWQLIRAAASRTF
jgi:hypothetical protein